MPRFAAVPSKRLTTTNIDQHVALIKGQVDKSLRDPESRQLAVKIVSGRVTWRATRTGAEEIPMIQAWGEWFEDPVENLKPCPPRTDFCEIEFIWNFMVRNCRYVFDITDVDVFVTLEQTLKAGGGDCDDATIGICALLKAIGFQTKARVISTPDSPNEWVHIYPLVGVPKAGPTHWIPLDCTVTDAIPGWEYDHIAKKRDYDM